MLAFPLRGRRPVLIHTFHGHSLTGYFSEHTAAVYRNCELKVPRIIELDTLPPAAAQVRASAWGIERLGALSAWGAYGARGKGVKIANSDPP